MTKLTRDAVKEFGLSVKEADRCRNFFAMGLVFWIYGRSLDPTLRFIESKFGKKPRRRWRQHERAEGGLQLRRDRRGVRHPVPRPKAELEAGQVPQHHGQHRPLVGPDRRGEGVGKRLFLGAYPITPASDILHELCKHKNFDVLTFQAEDEIAAMTATIGASFAGAMAVTASSGPGIALKGEALGLAVMMELPMVVISVQRGGPSTGLPTKTEQSDLNQADVRPQRRVPDARDRRPQPRRLLRRRARGLAPRDPLHDAGLPDDRRLHRQRLGAVEDPEGGGPAEDRRSSTPARRPTATPFHPYQAQRAPRPPVGAARHARPGAPPRRPREGRTARATSATTRATTST